MWTFCPFFTQHHQLRDYENKEEEIIERVKSGNLEEGAVIDATELNRLKECISEQDKTIEALKVACSVSKSNYIYLVYTKPA